MAKIDFGTTHFEQGAEAREQRRKFGRVHYVGGFDLAREIREICGPLAVEIAELLAMPFVIAEQMPITMGGGPGPFPLLHPVDNLAKAVHELRRLTTEWLARRVDAGGRQRLAAVVSDPAHGRCPEVSEQDLRTGLWVGDLVGHVSPLSADLGAVMAAMPDPGPLGCTAADAAVADLLRPVDVEAGIVRQQIPGIRSRQLAAHRRRLMWERERADREAYDRKSELQRLGLG